MINFIKCRSDRCCLERILGCIFYSEYPQILSKKSLFGEIMKYQKWGYTYDNYINDIIYKKKIIKPIIKIWTGR